MQSAGCRQGVQLLILDGLHNIVGNVNDDFLAILHNLARIRVAAVGRPQDGSAARQDPAHFHGRERENTARQQETVKAILDSNYMTAIIVDGRLDNCPDDSIQTRCIAAAG